MSKVFSSRKLMVVLLMLGVAGILDTLVLLFYAGPDFGILFPGLIGILLVFVSVAKLYFKTDAPLIKNAFLRRALFIVIALWSLSFIIVEGLIISSGASDEKQDVDYLMILGAGLRGEELTLALQARMYQGLEYLRENPEVKVIVSGGKGIGEEITEAEAMKRFLVEHGVEEDRILEEGKSTSTMENFSFSKEIIMKDGGSGESRIMIVTNDFHMFRARMLAKRNGFIAAYGLSAPTPLPVLPNCYIREYFALIKSFFMDRP